jgi:hypothetical protein
MAWPIEGARYVPVRSEEALLRLTSGAISPPNTKRMFCGGMPPMVLMWPLETLTSPKTRMMNQSFGPALMVRSLAGLLMLILPLIWMTVFWPPAVFSAPEGRNVVGLAPSGPNVWSGVSVIARAHALFTSATCCERSRVTMPPLTLNWLAMFA